MKEVESAKKLFSIMSMVQYQVKSSEISSYSKAGSSNAVIHPRFHKFFGLEVSNPLNCVSQKIKFTKRFNEKNLFEIEKCFTIVNIFPEKEL